MGGVGRGPGDQPNWGVSWVGRGELLVLKGLGPRGSMKIRQRTSFAEIIRKIPRKTRLSFGGRKILLISERIRHGLGNKVTNPLVKRLGVWSFDGRRGFSGSEQSYEEDRGGERRKGVRGERTGISHAGSRIFRLQRLIRRVMPCVGVGAAEKIAGTGSYGWG